MIFLEFVVQLNRLVGVIFCLLKNLMGFLIGVLQNSLLALVNFALLFFQLFFKRFDFQFVLLNFCLFLLNCDTAGFQGSHHILEGFIFLADLFFCFLDDVIRQTEL